MKALILMELERYKLWMAAVLAAAVIFAVGAVWLDLTAPHPLAMFFCYLLALLVAFVCGRTYDFESQEFRFLAMWPLSRAHIFGTRLLSHLFLAVLVIVALYVVAVAAMLLAGRPFGSFTEEHVINPTGVRAISLLCLVFALSAFWSQFTNVMLSLLLTLVSVIAVRYWIAAGVMTAFYWRAAAAEYISKAEMFERMRLWTAPSWLTVAVAACALLAAAAGFMRAPLLEVRRRALLSSGIVVAVLAALGLLFSLQSTNWLGFSEAKPNAVELGMRKAQVFEIMGPPEKRYLRSRLGAALASEINNIGGEPPGGEVAARQQGAEVWRWSYPVDQKIGIVFDEQGRVIYKWVDY